MFRSKEYTATADTFHTTRYVLLFREPMTIGTTTQVCQCVKKYNGDQGKVALRLNIVISKRYLWASRPNSK